MRNNKRGQLTLADGPSVVLAVGLIFLVMATIAFIGQKYGDSIGSDVTLRVNNESIVATTAGTFVSARTACNFADFTIVQILNGTSSVVINSGNYSITTDGKIANTTSTYSVGASPTWNATYNYDYGGVACNVTQDLNTEIANNTSIAGIVLTISLVGIVLTVLIGIFLVARAPGRA